MRLTLMLTIAALTIVAAAPAKAQAPEESRALKELLEKKFGGLKSRGPQPGTPAPGAAQPGRRGSDFYVISPDGKVREAPAKRDRRSEVPAAPAAPTRPAFVVASAAGATSSGDGETSGWLSRIKSFFGWATDAKRIRERLRQRGDDLREALTPTRHRELHVRKNGYTVQFKPDVTGEQIDEFLKKYDLEVVRAVPVLGIVYVEHKSAPVRQRRLLPGMRKRVRARITNMKRELFAPRILRRMRSEPYVNAATVQASLTPQTIPPASSTEVPVAENKRYYWSWRPADRATEAEGSDGNWGLKRMRVPAAWNIISSMRLHAKTGKPALMAFLDTGFGWHEHLTYTRIHGVTGTRPPPTTSPTCAGSHGTHVAGIAGAAYGLGRGIDGIVPGATIEAIPITSGLYITALKEQIEDRREQQALIFLNVLENLTDFIIANPVEPGRKRIINVSLTYNWRALNAEIDAAGNLVDEGLRTHILHQAKMLQLLQRLLGRDTIFVVAAGNDSDGLAMPLSAKWASPIGYLGHPDSNIDRIHDNILIVEAVNRTGNRASFSNMGGHVSAPGTEIMSTLSGRKDAYGLCAGTSQAAPHVTAVAAMLAEIAPKKTAAEIVAIIRETAVPHPNGTVAPRIDALEAILRTSPDALRILADLNGDGEVNADDVETYRRHHAAMTTVFASAMGRYFFDLNQDGLVEDNEHWYPRIDLNGSGTASDEAADRRCIMRQPASDLDVMYRAWTDKKVTFGAAVSEARLPWRKPADSAASPNGMPVDVAKLCPW